MTRYLRLLFALVLMVSCAAESFDVSAASRRGRKRPYRCGVTRVVDCPIEGCGGDAKLNVNKNRTDRPVDTEDWTIGRILALDVDSPTTWKRGQDRYGVEALGEGRSVRVEAFLTHANVTGTPETTNCRLNGERNNDYHLLLVGRKNDRNQKGVVAEITPRLREAGWTIAKLRKLASKRTRVRVSGYLLFDSAHTQPALTYRGTAWEIHPVTRFEIETKGGWVGLEDVE